MTSCEWILFGVGLFLALILLLLGSALKLAYELGANREYQKHNLAYRQILRGQVDAMEQVRSELSEYSWYGELVGLETLAKYAKLENDFTIPIIDKVCDINKGDENENEL